jgi:hypothetical protein
MEIIWKISVVLEVNLEAGCGMAYLERICEFECCFVFEIECFSEMMLFSNTNVIQDVDLSVSHLSILCQFSYCIMLFMLGGTRY